MGHEHFFDLAGVDVEPAPDDHVLRPVDDVVPPVGVAAGEVAGAEPALDDRLGGRLRAVIVAGHHVVSLHGDLADGLRGPLDLGPPTGIGVYELHGDSGNGL